MLSCNNTRENSKHGHHQMISTEIRLIIFSAKDGELTDEHLILQKRTLLLLLQLLSRFSRVQLCATL